MNRLLKPFPLTAGFVLIILLLAATEAARVTNTIGIFFGLFLAVLFIHEAGHALLGKMAGYRFHYLIVGPITIEKSPGFRLKANDNWMMYGGVTSSTPDTTAIGNIIPKHKWFVLGGPLLSLLAAIAGITISAITANDFALYFAWLNFVIFLVTIVPYQGALKSDGRVFWELAKGGKSAADFLLYLLLLKQMMSPSRPEEWPAELIGQAENVEPASETATTGLFLFYHAISQQDYKLASRAVEPYKQLAVTKKTKIPLQFFSHLKQIDALVNGQATSSLINEQHALLSAFEPISYKRSEAIIAWTEGNLEKAKQKLQEVHNECEKGKHSYGFFHAEQQLTLFLETQLYAEREGQPAGIHLS